MPAVHGAVPAEHVVVTGGVHREHVVRSPPQAVGSGVVVQIIADAPSSRVVDVVVHVPVGVVLGRPGAVGARSEARAVFRLRRGDEIYSASDNLIEGDKIMLRFKDVENFDDTEIPEEDLELLMASPFGDLVLSWTPGGDLTWRFEALMAQDEESTED
jgi:hypothetical protein